jgi:hypothetical protein
MTELLEHHGHPCTLPRETTEYTVCNFCGQKFDIDTMKTCEVCGENFCPDCLETKTKGACNIICCGCLVKVLQFWDRKDQIVKDFQNIAGELDKLVAAVDQEDMGTIRHGIAKAWAMAKVSANFYK